MGNKKAAPETRGLWPPFVFHHRHREKREIGHRPTQTDTDKGSLHWCVPISGEILCAVPFRAKCPCAFVWVCG
ncbi:MAG: hypothetical protein JRF20_09005 [Deltaproteobacteria bacterium]|nr:hypothetical protein [Deltaproteobacteria bacterium]MBW2351309.1 hypothetical protein [Deltaproteobacteria bacterium]